MTVRAVSTPHSLSPHPAVGSAHVLISLVLFHLTVTGCRSICFDPAAPFFQPPSLRSGTSASSSPPVPTFNQFSCSSLVKPSGNPVTQTCSGKGVHGAQERRRREGGTAGRGLLCDLPRRHPTMHVKFSFGFVLLNPTWHAVAMLWGCAISTAVFVSPQPRIWRHSWRSNTCRRHMRPVGSR